MTKQQMDAEALARAQAGGPNGNYGLILSGFTAKGIALDEIQPRDNVLTYAAWRAKGRQVRKGEHGVRITTYVPREKREPDGNGGERVTRFTMPRAATVFHVSQTDESTE